MSRLPVLIPKPRRKSCGCCGAWHSEDGPRGPMRAASARIRAPLCRPIGSGCAVAVIDVRPTRRPSDRIVANRRSLKGPRRERTERLDFMRPRGASTGAALAVLGFLAGLRVVLLVLLAQATLVVHAARRTWLPARMAWPISCRAPCRPRFQVRPDTCGRHWRQSISRSSVPCCGVLLALPLAILAARISPRRGCFMRRARGDWRSPGRSRTWCGRCCSSRRWDSDRFRAHSRWRSIRSACLGGCSQK